MVTYRTTCLLRRTVIHRTAIHRTVTNRTVTHRTAIHRTVTNRTVTHRTAIHRTVTATVRIVIHTMEETITPLGTATVRTDIRTTGDPSVETKPTRPSTDCARPLLSY
jgi:hypothetical protein